MNRRALLESSDMQVDPSVPEAPEDFVPPELTDGEVYHVFFSYYSTDYQWTHSVIEKLEARGLKVCFHERDFIPGRTIVDNMSESIQQSQKVLLVLSPDFVRSHWCLLEANMSMFTDSLDRKPIVPVLLQPDVTIPAHLSQLTYLEANHPDFTNQLLRVLCTPNQQLQGSIMVPYQPPTIYNGKILQPLIAFNSQELNNYDCGVWSNIGVPEQLQLIIQDPGCYSEAITIISSVSQKKVRFRSFWTRVLAVIVALIFCCLLLFIFVLILNDLFSDLYVLKMVVPICLAIILFGVIYKVVNFKKNETKHVMHELQKAVGRANTLLFEENILMGSESNSKIYLVYVLLDGCRRELTRQDKAEDAFQKALLKFSSDYTCCLVKKYVSFTPPADTGHLEGGVCFCQYVSQQHQKLLTVFAQIV